MLVIVKISNQFIRVMAIDTMIDKVVLIIISHSFLIDSDSISHQLQDYNLS